MAKKISKKTTPKRQPKKAPRNTVSIRSIQHKEETYKTVETCSGEVAFRFPIKEIAEEIGVTILQIAHKAEIQASLIYFIESSNESYVARQPRIDVLIRLMAAINALAEEYGIDKEYELSDMIKIL